MNVDRNRKVCPGFRTYPFWQLMFLYRPTHLTAFICSAYTIESLGLVVTMLSVGILKLKHLQF